MKKFYAFFAAALMSVSVFAAKDVVPTDADLANYYEQGNVCVCFFVPAEMNCNNIVVTGSFNGWKSTASDCVPAEVVAGFDGWYVASFEPEAEPDAEKGIQAKPVMLDGSGNFSWDYQVGAATVIRGGVQVIQGGVAGEIDLVNYGADAPNVFTIEAWKNNPCTAVYHTYNVTLISPDCNDEDYITPAISGGFNNWAQQAMEMNELKTAERQQAELPGAVFEVSFKAAEGSEFKFRSAEEWGKDWTNQLKVYNVEDDEWAAFNGGANLVLGEETNLLFDLGDPELYSWDNCEKPVVEEPEYVVVAVNVPANAPAAGVEIIGEFDGWTGTAMELLNTGWWFATISAEPSQAFKFREAGTWDNEIVYVQKISEEGKPVGLDNIKFKDVWKDDTYKGTPCKWIELDYSDANTYVWKTDWVAPTGVENIVLTESAQKVMVEGVLYIVRDNKLFNVQGTQIR